MSEFFFGAAWPCGPSHALDEVSVAAIDCIITANCQIIRVAGYESIAAKETRLFTSGRPLNAAWGAEGGLCEVPHSRRMELAQLIYDLDMEEGARIGWWLV